jgi:hypothetical protein
LETCGLEMPADTDAFPAAFREHMDPLVSQKQFVTNEI